MADFIKLKESILKRANADLEFRLELKKDPKGTIEKYYPDPSGQKIPQRLNIVVCEDNDTTIYLNIMPSGFHPDCY